MKLSILAILALAATASAAAVHQPTGAHKSAVHKPAVHKPVAHKPVAHKPAAHKPAAHKPAAHKPAAHKPKKQHRKHPRKHVVAQVASKKSSGGNSLTIPRITFYDGSSLDAPACGGGKTSASSMSAAVKEGGKFKCGDKINLNNGGHSITVKVVDYCAGCADAAIDLTPSAFKALGVALDVGEIHGAKGSIV
ncbi:hypothetical protein HKX48_003000 [Thoreauomyces humboldtii]|nr:hypothetical protein HKX48_003000 [Thoreauomyces humboldtii]